MVNRLLVSFLAVGAMSITALPAAAQYNSGTSFPRADRDSPAETQRREARRLEREARKQAKAEEKRARELARLEAEKEAMMAAEKDAMTAAEKEAMMKAAEKDAMMMAAEKDAMMMAGEKDAMMADKDAQMMKADKAQTSATQFSSGTTFEAAPAAPIVCPTGTKDAGNGTCMMVDEAAFNRGS